MLTRRTISACLVLALLAIIPATAWAEVTITPAARAAFKKGVDLLRDRDGARYAEAYEAFQEAYAEAPSPKILGNLGLCAMKLERDGEAIDAYERYLGEVGAVNKREHRQIVEDLVRLKAESTAVELSVEPPAAVVIDERLPAGGAPVINEYPLDDGRLATRLRQGRHRFRVEADGYLTATWSVEVTKGEPIEHRFELIALAEPEPEPDPLPPTATPDAADDEGGFPSVGFIVAASATGVFGTVTGIVGGLALSNKSSFDEAVAAGDTAEATSLRDRGQTLNGATDGLLVATGVAAAVTIVFLVLDLTSEEDDDDAEAAVGVVPIAGPQHAGVGLSGAF